MTYSLVSADSHINEPPDLWTSVADAELGQVVPQVIATERGDAWIVSPELRPRPVGTSAQAGVNPEDYLKEPVTYRTMRRGSFDPVARLEDMDVDGVDAEVLYPGIGRALQQCATAEVRAFCARAYNDWIAGFQSSDPDRLIGLAILAPLDDGAGAQQELARAASLGLRGAFLAIATGGIPLSHPDNEPFWSTAEELGIPISLHIGADAAIASRSDQAARPRASGARAPGVREAWLGSLPMSISEHIGVLIFGGVLERHPGLRIVIAESGVGWIPFFLERLESVYDRHRHYLKSTVARRPTEQFQSQMFVTFQEDEVGLRLRDMLGVGSMMWASDYPHTDTTWPNSLAVVKESFSGLPSDDAGRILAGNCRQLYGLG